MRAPCAAVWHQALGADFMFLRALQRMMRLREIAEDIDLTRERHAVIDRMAMLVGGQQGEAQ